jgi:hypothetical protein
MKNPAWRSLGMIALALTLFSPHRGFGSQDFYPGDYSQATIIGNSLPGTWRPFSDDSPWNTPIPPDAVGHPDSDGIMATVVAEAANLRFAYSYLPPVWVVNSDNLAHHIADSPYPFDTWDQNLDGITEAGVPITTAMFGENTADGHISIIDPFKMLAWEMSGYTGIVDGVIDCNTFNIWDLTGKGVGDGNEGARWRARGGRGSGFPIIAGLIRPEELEEGEIRHALVFTFPKNRSGSYLPPAARTDGGLSGSQYPMEGMLFQLDPALTDSDFDRWGLSREGKIVARALQRYGMYDGDNGGAMAVQLQLLHPSGTEHRAIWESRFPGFYDNVRKIPTDRFRVVNTVEPVTGGAQTTVVSPLILPLGGPATTETATVVTISTPTRDARITYTADGSTPDGSSTPYDGPFEIDGPMIIKARAFASGKTPSSVTLAVFGEMTALQRPAPPILLDD